MPRQLPSLTWKCVLCTFMNSVDNKYCGVCEASKEGKIDEEKNDSSVSKGKEKKNTVVEEVLDEKVEVEPDVNKEVSKEDVNHIVLSEWMCKTCTFLSSLDSKFCQMCETERPIDAKIISPLDKIEVKDDGWNCNSCSLFNRHTGLVCAGCRAPKNGDTSIVLPDKLPPKYPVLVNDGFIKNKFVVANFDASAFQLSLRRYPEDPLLIRIFPGLGYHCIPQLGIYGENYNPLPPLVLIELHEHFLNPIILNLLSHRVEFSNREMYIMIHDNLIPDNSIEPMMINVMAHMWTFAHAEFDLDVILSDKFEVGLFEPYNVTSCPESDSNIASAPLPFNQLKQRCAIIHHGSFSPNNCQFIIHPIFPFHSFFLVSIYNGRCVVTFHIIVGTSLREELRESVIKSNSLRELMQCWSVNPRLKDICNNFSSNLTGPFALR